MGRIDEVLARRFCERHHYSGGLGAVRVSVGLWEALGGGEEDLVGACVFGMLMQPRAAKNWCGQDARQVPELHRLCLLDRTPFNGESWFVARALLSVLRERIPAARALISYADPVPRHDAQGRVTKFGHVGTCYQALSTRFTGTSSRRTLIVARDGRIISEGIAVEAAQRRARRAVCRAAVGRRLCAGSQGRGGAPRLRGPCPARGPFRQIRHPGNLVYVMALDGQADTVARLAPELSYLDKAALGLDDPARAG